MRPISLAAIAATLILSTTFSARAITLYDGALNTFPENQGWLFYGQDAAVTTKTAAGGKTTFDTGTSTTKAGWSNTIPIINTLVNPSFPTLDRANGFVLGFDVKVLSESHLNNDRAGFDIILLASDHQGVELGFWTNEIWAQTLSGATFVHGEGSAVSTTSATHYDLGIHGSTYELFANGSASPILTGPVRDYSSALAIPYGLPNYLFVGDDTTSATASIELSKLTIVPEPMCALLVPVAMTLTRRLRGRSARSR